MFLLKADTLGNITLLQSFIHDYLLRLVVGYKLSLLTYGSNTPNWAKLALCVSSPVLIKCRIKCNGRVVKLALVLVWDEKEEAKDFFLITFLLASSKERIRGPVSMLYTSMTLTLCCVDAHVRIT